jgi:hypothetical protein
MKKKDIACKGWRENYLNNFVGVDGLRFKPTPLRNINSDYVNKKTNKSLNTSPICTKNHSVNDLTIKNEKKTEILSSKKSKKYFRNLPARFLNAKSIKIITKVNRSSVFINPHLKEDLKLIQDNSWDSLNKNLKEEKLYLKYKAENRHTIDFPSLKSVRFVDS